MHEFRYHAESGCRRCCFCGAYPTPEARQTDAAAADRDRYKAIVESVAALKVGGQIDVGQLQRVVRAARDALKVDPGG